MTLKEQLEKDYIEAYKGHDEARVSLLRMIKSALKNQEIASKTEATDEDVVKLLRREVKQRAESIAEYEKGGRNDLIATEKAEIALIEPYLPAQMSQDELKKIISEVTTDLDATSVADVGWTIGAVMKKAGPQADGAMVAQLVKEALSR